jgi:hypothetical protein
MLLAFSGRVRVVTCNSGVTARSLFSSLIGDAPRRRRLGRATTERRVSVGGEREQRRKSEGWRAKSRLAVGWLPPLRLRLTSQPTTHKLAVKLAVNLVTGVDDPIGHLATRPATQHTEDYFYVLCCVAGRCKILHGVRRITHASPACLPELVEVSSLLVDQRGPGDERAAP